MNNEVMALLRQVALHSSQTQAAAFAVLAGAIRENVSEAAEAFDDAQLSATSKTEVLNFLSDLEMVMIESIQKNDGKVAQHIGHAAKQMNPLL